jgi:DNA modification methylase
MATNSRIDELSELKWLRDHRVQEFWNLARNRYTDNETLYAILAICVDEKKDNRSQFMAARLAAMNIASRQSGSYQESWEVIGQRESGGHFYFASWGKRQKRVLKPNGLIHLDSLPR